MNFQPNDVLFIVPDTAPGEELKLENGKPTLTFRKELIYIRKGFRKKTKDHDQTFDIDEMKLAHWAETGNRMVQNGVKIPLPLKHSDNPEAGRGHILRFETGLNKKGIPALFGICKFRDEEAAKLAKSTDVSIFVPEHPVYDGFGNEYVYPIRHVALTDYPVIPGLGEFEAIAASLDSLELGGPGSGPRKGGGSAIVKYNGLKERTVGDYARMKFGKAMPHLKKIGKASVRLGKKIAKHPITRVVAAAELLNAGVKQLHGEKVNRRVDSYRTAIGGYGMLKSTAAFHKAEQAAYRATRMASKVGPAHEKYWSNQAAKNRALADMYGGAVVISTIPTSVGVLNLLRKSNKKNKQQELSLGGPGSGPRKGTFSSRLGARIGTKVGEKVGGATGRFAKRTGFKVARGIVTGEITNHYAKKLRGDSENRRLPAYLSRFLVQQSATGFISAHRRGKAAKELGATAHTLKNPSARTLGRIAAAGAKAGRIKSLVGATATGVGSLFSLHALLKKGKQSRGKSLSLSLGVARKIGSALKHGVGDSWTVGTIGHGVGDNAKTKKRHALAAGTLGASAYLGARELRHSGKAALRVGKVSVNQFKKRGLRGAVTALTRTSKGFAGASARLVRGRGVLGKVGKAVSKTGVLGSRVGLPIIGAALGAHALYAGAKYGVKHLKKSVKLSQELSLGGPGSGPQEGQKRGHYRKIAKYLVAGSVAAHGAERLGHAALAGAAAKYVMKDRKGKAALAALSVGKGLAGGAYLYGAKRLASEPRTEVKKESKNRHKMKAWAHKRAAEFSDLAAAGAGTSALASAAVTPHVFKFVQGLDVGRKGKIVGHSVLTRGVAAYSVAKLLAAIGLHQGAKRLKARAKLHEEAALSLAQIVDQHGNIHGQGGRFVKKPSTALSKSTQRRRLNALKPKVGEENYFRDRSEESVSSDRVSSGFQAVKHAAQAGVYAGGAYATGRFAVKGVQNVIKHSPASEYKKKAYSKAYAAATKAAKEAGDAAREKAIRGKRSKAVVEQSSKAAFEAAMKKAKRTATTAANSAAKLRNKRLGKLGRVGAFARHLKGKKLLLVQAAGAAAAAAAASHKLNEHLKATRLHATNVLFPH